MAGILDVLYVVGLLLTGIGGAIILAGFRSMRGLRDDS